MKRQRCKAQMFSSLAARACMARKKEPSKASLKSQKGSKMASRVASQASNLGLIDEPLEGEEMPPAPRGSRESQALHGEFAPRPSHAVHDEFAPRPSHEAMHDDMPRGSRGSAHMMRSSQAGGVHRVGSGDAQMQRSGGSRTRTSRASLGQYGSGYPDQHYERRPTAYRHDQGY